MATLLLQAAGATLGGVFGPVGAAIGSAVGATAGYYVDQALFGSSRNVDGARLTGAQFMTADEGGAIARVYGYGRVSTTLIWATEFEEQSSVERQGGKSGPTVTTYDYFGNFALGICEGQIAGIKRIWADGKELDLRDLQYRVYLGTENQHPDPLIEAKQGTDNAPAYRGLAYIVFQRLPLERFGNRIPQIQVEVLKPVGKLEKNICAATIIPGATEHGLNPNSVTIRKPDGTTEEVNRHITFADSDWHASIDELQAICPNLKHVSLVVTWYCDDLRAGMAKLRPGVTYTDDQQESDKWQVDGLTRTSNDTHIVSRTDGRPAYGGTPSDNSVIAAIQDLKSRGLKVTLNPFILMDVPPDNVLPDPYSDGHQAAYPWRGRISCTPAVGRPGSADKTAQSRRQIEAFLGRSAQTDFGYRRMILHCADLARSAGGVDAFLIGSEMRGLTTARDHANAFPFVEGLIALAADVRSVLGASTSIIYSADWSEYFGYQPQDGSGDVYFHLDPLWADPNIAAIGIDYYMPLSDWREHDNDPGKSNPDGALHASDTKAFEAAIESGEGCDWYYATEADRLSRTRTPISDGAYGKAWTFRYKDLKSWWSNFHYNRVGGVEQSEPTVWRPESKQFIIMEVGCPAIHAGATQPNVFVDEKSSESAYPHYSNGSRDDSEQRAYLEAHHSFWRQIGTRNPISTINSKPMVDPEQLYIWAWDARPLPAYPLNTQYWGDGENWMRGHWGNGRLGSAPAADLVSALCKDHGLADVDSEYATGSIGGMVIGSPTSLRGALEPLLQVINAVASDAGSKNGDEIRVFARETYAAIPAPSQMRVDSGAAPLTTETVSQISELPRQITITYRDPMNEYQTTTSYSRRLENGALGEVAIDVPCVLETDQAAIFVEKMLSNAWSARSTASFHLPLDYCWLTSGDVINFDAEQSKHWMISRITLTDRVEIEARSISKPKTLARNPRLPNISPSNAQKGIFGGPPKVVAMDLPMAEGSRELDQFRVAILSNPKKPQAIYLSPADDGYELRQLVEKNATIGTLVNDLSGTFSGRWDHSTTIDVLLGSGELDSKKSLLVLAGRNSIAIQSQSGNWEIVQYLSAHETRAGHWRLSDLLRGQLGTEDAMAAGSAAGARVVVLNSSITPIGLTEAEVGLDLNMRVGPAGKEFSDRYFETSTINGGVRALKPLAPVHLKAKFQQNGDLFVQWVRRSRVNADSWMGTDVPLGEEFERYRVDIFGSNESLLISQLASLQSVTIPNAKLTPHRGSAPIDLEVRVTQISERIGDGIAALHQITLPSTASN